MNNLMSHIRAEAERGDANAQFNFGMFCDNNVDENGHAAARDRIEAIKWLLKAANQGLGRAQSRLADIYVEESDLKRAYAWYLVATANPRGINIDHTRIAMARIAPKLTETDIDRAGARARALIAKINVAAPPR